MERKKFKIDGREYEDYQLSNEQIVRLLESEDITDTEHEHLMKKVLERFKYDACKRSGEENEDLFARQFGDFVNGKCHDKKRVANGLCREHRYLQNEMFKVCMEYIKALAENGKKGYFDPRNQYACETSKKIIELLDKEGVWY